MCDATNQTATSSLTETFPEDISTIEKNSRSYNIPNETLCTD